jgi:hypothetical protein
MLHTVYNLQESMETEHFAMYLKHSRKWVLENLDKAGTEPEPPPHDTIENDWLSILKFAPHLVNDDKPINRVPAPILTRWWYVGVAAEFFLEHYLSLFRTTQAIANDFNADSRANEVGSHLYSLMLEPQLYSDLVFCGRFMWSS